MTKSRTLMLGILILALGCAENNTTRNFHQQTSWLGFIEGKTEYLNSQFVTAGDRVYMVGHQNGTFPDLGWHIEGEMGGIWDHPIKLLDGFAATLRITGNTTDIYCLNKADKFVNYPVGNSHHFSWREQKLDVERFQFVPDGVEGMVIEFRIMNEGSEDREIEFSFSGMTDLRPTWLGERTHMIDAEDEILFDDELSAVIAKDKNNTWYTAFGSTHKGTYSGNSIAACDPIPAKGLGKKATLSFSFHLKSKEEIIIPIFIAGSYNSEAMLKSNFQTVKTEAGSRLSRKIDRYKKINSTSHLTIADKGHRQKPHDPNKGIVH